MRFGARIVGMLEGIGAAAAFGAAFSLGIEAVTPSRAEVAFGTAFCSGIEAVVPFGAASGVASGSSSGAVAEAALEYPFGAAWAFAWVDSLAEALPEMAALEVVAVIEVVAVAEVEFAVVVAVVTMAVEHRYNSLCLYSFMICVYMYRRVYKNSLCV